MTTNAEELVILRMGVLLSPPISVRYGSQDYRIPVHSHLPINFDEGRSSAPTEFAAHFKQQGHEFLAIGDSHYRVLDFVIGGVRRPTA